MNVEVTITINGSEHTVQVPPRTLLSQLLRDELDLTGTHVGCDTSSCGACTVLVNGNATKSCTMFAVQADGCEVTTVEGLASNGRATPDPDRFQGKTRLAVRLLHSRNDGDRGTDSRTQPIAVRSRDSQRFARQSMPLHWLSQHRRCGPVRRRDFGR